MLPSNPEATKAVVALGLLMIVDRVPMTLVLADLQGRTWGDRMAVYNGVIFLLKSLVAIFAAGPLGRLGDRFGNKITVAFVLLVEAMPTFILLLLGVNQFSLKMWGIMEVVSGVTASTISGSPACYALINELSAPDEVEKFLGLGFACLSIFSMIGNLVGMLVRYCISERAVLVFIALLAACCAVILGTIGKPAVDMGAWHNFDEELARRLERKSKMQELRRQSSLATIGNVVEYQEAKPPLKLLGTLRFACEHQVLGTLCVLAAVISIPETILFDVQLQFVYDVFGLLNSSEDTSTRRTLLALLSVTAAQITFAIGSFWVGLLAKRFSAFEVLLWLLPIVAVAQSLPALLPLVPYLWAVAATGMLLGLALVVLAPLQALVAESAPSDRASEAMGAIGSAKALATILGELLVTGIVPLLGASSVSHPLWVLYPVSGLISLTGLLILQRIRYAKAKASLTAVGHVELAARLTPQRGSPASPMRQSLSAVPEGDE